MQYVNYQRLLLVAHSTFMLFAAAYVSYMYPMAWLACVILAISGISVALMPLRWRQRAIGEITYLLAAIIASTAQWLLYGQEPESVQGLSRIILVSLVLVLVPNRPGQVRSLAMLVALELLLLDRLEDLNDWVYIALSCIAVSALFLDSWLRLQNRLPIGVRIRNRHLSQPWVPLGLCLILFVLICLPVSHAVKEIGQQHRFKFNNPGTTGSNSNQSSLELDETLRLGSNLWSSQDSSIVARYIPDRADLLNPRQSTYIRGMCVPNYELLPNGMMNWSGPKNAVPYTGEPIPEPPFGNDATIIRYQTADRIVLRPDGSDTPAVENFFFDSEGNVYSEEQNISNNRYRSAVSKPSYIRTPTNAQREDDPYLQVPRNLRQQFQQNIPQLEQWRVLSADQAAKQIQLYLQRQCRYQTKDLPQVAPIPGACMSVFLFGTRDQRIGHCQYFSSAATLLLRSCGHVTRPVFGFSSNEVDSSGSKSLILRAWHAHAWVEYINDSGNWQRLDCTPPDYLNERIRGAELPSDEEISEDPLQAELTDSFSWQPYLIIIVSVSFGCCVLWLIMREKAPVFLLDARKRQLAEQEAALLACAQSLGIQVKESHTLTHIVRAIEQVSGINLNQQLRDHLAARYHDAQILSSWPISTITAAAKQKRDTAET